MYAINTDADDGVRTFVKINNFDQENRWRERFDLQTPHAHFQINVALVPEKIAETLLNGKEYWTSTKNPEGTIDGDSKRAIVRSAANC